MNPKIDDLIEGTVESLAFGGEGILRYNDFVFFIPFTIPGEKVICRVTQVKRSFGYAQIVKISQPSSFRVKPKCPYFGTCGGCQLQHLDYKKQLEYKFNAVQDALKRVGHLSSPTPFPIISLPPYWNYRRHVTLQLKPHGNAFKAGYIAKDNQSLVMIQTCPIFNEIDQPILDFLQNLLSQLLNLKKQTGRITLLKNSHSQFILFFQFEEGFEVELNFFKNTLQQNPLVAGILIKVFGKKTISLGNIYAEQEIEGLPFYFTPQVFIQNNIEQSSAIYRKVCELAKQIPHQHILDLYCGFGITSSLLAQQGHQVVGIECNPFSIELAQANAFKNSLNNLKFIAGSVENKIDHLLKMKPFDTVLMNPPRKGLSKEVINYLIKTQPRYLLYISCMPSTLARDLKVFCEQNYQLKEGFIYDMFPQTAHVETLVCLECKK